MDQRVTFLLVSLFSGIIFIIGMVGCGEANSTTIDETENSPESTSSIPVSTKTEPNGVPIDQHGTEATPDDVVTNPDITKSIPENNSPRPENTLTEEPITKPVDSSASIIFLHHSTGGVIWGGGVSDLIESYNASNSTDYEITEQDFPKTEPYGWTNYPYDYWNIWVNHAGDSPYMEEPTLEILTQDYDVIIWKHCYPVTRIKPDKGNPSIDSDKRRIENYKLQYDALKRKMHEFSDTKFIVWTGAAQVSGDPEQMQHAREFFEWVKNGWDEEGDNIFLWDFFELETEGDDYLKVEYAASPSDHHPNGAFAEMVAPYFTQRIVDVIEGRGDIASLTGQ